MKNENLEKENSFSPFPHIDLILYREIESAFKKQIVLVLQSFIYVILALFNCEILLREHLLAFERGFGLEEFL